MPQPAKPPETVPSAPAASPGARLFLGLRADGDVLGAAFAAGPSVEYWGPWLGVAAAVLVPPIALRVEGRLQFPLGPAAPFLSIGATAFSSLVVGLRAGLGVGVQLGPVRLVADAALEQFVLAPPQYEATAATLGLAAELGL